MISEQLDESFLVGEGWLFLSSVCQVTLDPNMLAFPTTIPPLHFLIWKQQKPELGPAVQRDLSPNEAHCQSLELPGIWGLGEAGLGRSPRSDLAKLGTRVGVGAAGSFFFFSFFIPWVGTRPGAWGRMGLEKRLHTQTHIPRAAKLPGTQLTIRILFYSIALLTPATPHSSPCPHQARPGQSRPGNPHASGFPENYHLSKLGPSPWVPKPPAASTGATACHKS